MVQADQPQSLISPDSVMRYKYSVVCFILPVNKMRMSTCHQTLPLVRIWLNPPLCRRPLWMTSYMKHSLLICVSCPLKLTRLTPGCDTDGRRKRRKPDTTARELDSDFATPHIYRSDMSRTDRSGIMPDTTMRDWLLSRSDIDRTRMNLSAGLNTLDYQNTAGLSLVRSDPLYEDHGKKFEASNTSQQRYGLCSYQWV